MDGNEQEEEWMEEEPAYEAHVHHFGCCNVLFIARLCCM